MSRPEKRHAACDECRIRKLKCPGEQPGCSRCAREDIPCVYSTRKPMGRPRKRRRDEGAVGQAGGERNTASYGELDPPVPANTIFADPAANGLLDLSGFEDLTYTEFLSAGDESLAPISLPPVPDILFHTPIDPVLLSGQDESLGSLMTGHNAPSSAPPIPQSPLNSTYPHQTIPQASIPNDPSAGPCNCLHQTYQTLSALTSSSTTTPPTPFPFSLPPLRHALTTTMSLITCRHCPSTHLTGLTSTNNLTTLLGAIAAGYQRVLQQLDRDAAAAAAGSPRKPMFLLLMGDADRANAHLHDPFQPGGCAARFQVELEPDEWRRLARKVVKADVLGDEPGVSGLDRADKCPSSSSSSVSHGGIAGAGRQPTLTGAIDAMERRQRRAHADPALDAMRQMMFGAEEVARANEAARKHPGGDAKEYLCLRMLANVRLMVKAMRLEE